jgi:hypothetical protein
METDTKLAGLKKFNWAMAVLHAAQGIAILALSVDFKLPITASYLTFDTATQSLLPASSELFKLSLPWLIAIFFFLSSFAHLSIATYYNKTYNENLLKGINKARWWEYSFSASIMMIAISLLVGIYDFGSLLMIFSLVMTMNLLGLVMEVHNQGRLERGEQPNWLSFNLGSFTGLIPWIVVGLAFYWSAKFSGATPPTFVYWIYVSIFVFFNCFAINMILQYKKRGKWADYLYGERAYIILSLVAKSLLAWQVFAGTLRP